MLYGILGNTRTVSVIGMCKNAGKTTALNALISACSANGETLGLTSIGRDGERSDLVTNTKKPEIFVPSGTVIATAQMLLAEGDISREILESTSLSTPMGNIVIVRARAAGYVQIGGPSMTEELKLIRDELIGLGCTRIFIDGAISRKSLGTPQLADGVVLCSGASYNPDMRTTAEDTAYIASLFSLPVYKTELDLSAGKFAAVGDYGAYFADTVSELLTHIKANGASAVAINGAVTDKIAAELSAAGKLLSGVALVALDASRMLLGKASYDKLRRFASGVYVLKGARLLAVTVNPFSAYGNHYDKTAFAELSAAAVHGVVPDVPVIDVSEV